MLASAILFALPAVSFGQQAAASINGTVRDSSGAVIPGASVTLTSTSTNVSRNSTTNSAGNYGFVNVLPGPYAISVKKTGFNVVQQPQFTV
ncbi:MAG: carboxypeptidase-like regulatory domain-containing protein, partial [Bryobacteraceae bacterium]